MTGSHSRLREALSHPPAGSRPRKPTSVPPMTLEALLKRAQDRHRGRPENWRDQLLGYRARTFDWGGFFFMTCIFVLGVCGVVIAGVNVLIAIAKLHGINP